MAKKSTAKKASARKSSARKGARDNDDPRDVSVEPLEPPDHGCAIRMYRQGLGDCFLLAFPGSKVDEPVMCSSTAASFRDSRAVPRAFARSSKTSVP
jgi:hypothetical protein